MNVCTWIYSRTRIIHVHTTSFVILSVRACSSCLYHHHTYGALGLRAVCKCAHIRAHVTCKREPKYICVRRCNEAQEALPGTTYDYDS